MLGMSCNEKKAAVAEKSEVQKIIEQAQTMSFDELCKKAIEESKNATIKGIGNSSRGKTAGAAFIEYLKSLDSSYAGTLSGLSQRTTQFSRPFQLITNHQILSTL